MYLACLFPFGNNWMKQTQEAFLFFTGILASAVLALSGEAKTSDKVFKKYSYVLAMSGLPGISKSKNGQGEGKKAGKRLPVLGHVVDTDLHAHTHVPHLQPSEHPPVQPRTPKGNATQRNAIEQAKEGRLLRVVGYKVSHATWRWDLAGGT